jgi:ribosomal protein L14E/L6E/L27E
MILTVDGLRHGQLICSLAGRDKGCYYIIWNTFGDRFIEVVDGNKHPIAKAKKKNLKHVKITMLVATEIENAISRGELVKDAQIVAAIKKRINELEEGDRFHG